VHDYHEGLPGYSPNQILHDGCAECEARAKSITHGMRYLDNQRFARAWERAAEWNVQDGDVRDISHAEMPLLRILWAVQVQLQRRGVHLGECPSGARISA